MTKRLIFQQNNTTIDVMMEIAGEGALLARGTTVPSDGVAGYAKGCFFLDTDGSSGAVLYVNEGTNASCDFNLALADETVSYLDGVVAGTVTASKALVVGASKEIGSLGTLTFADAANVVVNATTGTKIGTAVTQKLGFWNATPVVQPASANQAALTNSTGGAADGTLAAVGATNTGDVSAAINNNFTDIHTLLDAIRTALVNTGIIKGSA